MEPEFLGSHLGLWALALTMLILLTACERYEDPGFSFEGKIPVQGDMVIRR